MEIPFAQKESEKPDLRSEAEGDEVLNQDKYVRGGLKNDFCEPSKPRLAPRRLTEL